jgi:hypothetical protein
MVSMMGILSGATPLMVDVRQTGAGPGLAQTKIRQRLHDIKEQRKRIKADLTDIDTQIEVGVALLDAALKLLEDPQELYRQSTNKGRRLLNQAFFEKLYVGPDGIGGDEIKEPFRELIAVQRAVSDKITNELTHQNRPGTNDGDLGRPTGRCGEPRPTYWPLPFRATVRVGPPWWR